MTGAERLPAEGLPAEGRPAEGRPAERLARSRIASLYALTSALAKAVTVADVVDVVGSLRLESLGPPTMIGVGLTAAGERATLVTTVGAYVLPGTPIPEVVGNRVGDGLPGAWVVRSRTPVWLASPAELIERFPSAAYLIDRYGTGAVASLPLISQSGVIGSLNLLWTEPRAFPEDDQVHLTAIAEATAQALERARLFEQITAEQARTAQVQAAIAAVAGAASQADVIEAIVRHAPGAFGAGGGTIRMRSAEDSDALVLPEVGGAAEPSGAGRPRRSRTEDSPIALDAMRTGAPVYATSRSDVTGRYPSLLESLVETGVHAIAALPLNAGTLCVGVLTLEFAESRPFTDADRLALSSFAAQCSQAILRARRYDVEHDIARTLQLSLLPGNLPVLPNLAVTGRYLPGASGVDVGGDWYDAFVWDSGRIGLVIGDVIGSGVQAAATMGQLRTAIRTMTGLDDPAALLDQLDRVARVIPGAYLASVGCVSWEPGTQTLSYSVAGHPPPLLRLPDGTVHMLDGGRGALLASSLGGRRISASLSVPAGSVLLLYTDGLVERRRESLDVGFARLATALGGLDPDRADAPDRLIEAALAGYRQRDDLALLLVRFEPVPVLGFRHEFAAEATALAGLRRTLRAWLNRVEVRQDEATDIVYAIAEAATNAIEHGHREDGGTISVQADVDSHRMLTVRVCDQGRWVAPLPSVSRGRGLFLMRTMMDDVDLSTGPDGTRVTLSKQLHPSTPPTPDDHGDNVDGSDSDRAIRP